MRWNSRNRLSARGLLVTAALVSVICILGVVPSVSRESGPTAGGRPRPDKETVVALLCDAVQKGLTASSLFLVESALTDSVTLDGARCTGCGRRAVGMTGTCTRATRSGGQSNISNGTR